MNAELMNAKLIEAAQKNEKSFGLMSAELQEAMLDDMHRCGNLKNYEVYCWLYGKKGWHQSMHYPDSGKPVRGKYDVFPYRLRPDYKPESGIVECEILTFRVGAKFHEHGYVWDGLKCVINVIPDGYEREGFKFEDERKSVTAFPVIYMVEGHELPFYGVNSSDFDKTTILHATHILFRKLNDE
jgi:hypothetical protein